MFNQFFLTKFNQVIKKIFHQTKFKALLQKRICGSSKQKKAYSLIELAIVITILSILVTGSLVAVSKIYSQGKYNNTNYKIAEIYKALGAYLVANEKLPCPAPITSIKSNDSSYGVAGSCVATTGVYVSGDLVYGMVPVATLGLSKDFSEDGFASKIAYVVNKNFADSATFGNATYQNIITIKEAAQNSANNQTITNDAIFAIISYGFNKNGSLNTNISDIQNSCISSDDNEQENDIYPNLAAGSTSACVTLGSCPSRCPSSTTASFDNILFSSSSSADDFDDIVFYKTRNDLVSDFDALSLIKCPSSSLNITYGVSATTFSWQESKYNQIASSNTQCPTGYRSGVQFPTRKCGSYGNWETNLGDSNGLINPCIINVSSGGSGTGTCSHNITGTTVKTVNAGSGQLICNATGYDSTNKIDYTCSDGIFYKTTPAQTCGNCTSNYNTLSDGSCQVKPCDVSGSSVTTDITSVSSSVIHIFKSGTGSINCSIAKTGVRILVVGGGGAGGSHAGSNGTGGGGGGKVVDVTSFSLVSGITYNISVGAGGAGVYSNGGSNGGESKFSYSTTLNIIAPGGGGGGGANNGTGNSGGSSGGAHCNGIPSSLVAATLTGTTGTGTAYGNKGGSSNGCGTGGGGGGAGTAGKDAASASSPAAGGAGISMDITGSSLIYGAGGGGSPNGAAGGAGAGAAGSSASTILGNYGGGGGGTGNSTSGAGGSGVVIIRYPK